MAYKLKNNQNNEEDIVLWGHSLVNYRAMFDLKDNDLDGKILDCAAGLSSFNAEMFARGKHIVSSDPLYALSLPALKKEFDVFLEKMLSLLNKHIERFNWGLYNSPNDLISLRRSLAGIFFEDFEIGKREGRYCVNTLPELDFPDNEFDLVVCSHMLFTVSTLDIDFHLKALLNMCRVAEEARIFPLLDSSGVVSPLLGPLMSLLQQHDIGVELRQVDYEFQHIGNAMLRVWPQSCVLT